MLDSLTVDSFLPLVGSRFSIDLDGRSIDLELTEAKEARHYDDDERNPFSLLFQGPVEPLIPQGQRHFSHPDFSDMELFMVPLGPKSARGEGVAVMRYEVVFG